MENPLLHLPREVLEYIVQFLDICALGRSMRLCRRLRELLLGMKFSQSVHWTDIEHLKYCDNFTNVSVNISFVDSWPLNDNIGTLTLSRKDGFFEPDDEGASRPPYGVDEGDDEKQTTAPNLHTLHLDSFADPQQWKRLGFRALRSLYVDCYSPIEFDIRLPHLEEFSITIGHIPDIDFRNFPNLRKLLLRSGRCNPLDLSPLKKLEELSLSYRNNVLTELLLGEHPCLRVLKIPDHYHYHLDLSGCPNIVELRLAGRHEVDLRPLKMVKKLEIGDYSHQITTRMPSVKYIKNAGYKLKIDMGLFPWCINLPSGRVSIPQCVRSRSTHRKLSYRKGMRHPIPYRI